MVILLTVSSGKVGVVDGPLALVLADLRRDVVVGQVGGVVAGLVDGHIVVSLDGVVLVEVEVVAGSLTG